MGRFGRVSEQYWRAVYRNEDRANKREEKRRRRVKATRLETGCKVQSEDPVVQQSL